MYSSVQLCKEVNQSQIQNKPDPENRLVSVHTCAEERWSRATGLLSASSPSELQLCGAGRNIEAAAGVA